MMKVAALIFVIWLLSGIVFMAFADDPPLSMRYDLTSAYPAGLLIHDRKTDTVYFCGKNLVNNCRPWANLRELVP